MTLEKFLENSKRQLQLITIEKKPQIRGDKFRAQLNIQSGVFAKTGYGIHLLTIFVKHSILDTLKVSANDSDNTN